VAGDARVEGEGGGKAEEEEEEEERGEGEEEGREEGWSSMSVPSPDSSRASKTSRRAP